MALQTEEGSRHDLWSVVNFTLSKVFSNHKSKDNNHKSKDKCIGLYSCFK